MALFGKVRELEHLARCGWFLGFGIIAPSFAACATARDANLVVWKWAAVSPHKVVVIDDERRLPRNQDFWKTVDILMSGDARRKLRHDSDQQPHRSSVVVLVLASLDIRRAIPNIGQTEIMKPLLLALLFGLNLLGTPAMATEEPPFTVKSAHGEFEVRDYPALVAAEVTVTGDRKDASSKGFRLLAGYIFGGNTRKQSIAMTAPVTQAAAMSEKIAMTAPVLQTGGNGSWVIRFIMPRDSTLETLPRPNNPKVQLVAVPPARMAVVKFSGLPRQDDVDSKTAALSRFVNAQHLKAIGPPSLAQYNPPWTLWFMRRNEVMIPVSG